MIVKPLQNRPLQGQANPVAQSPAQVRAAPPSPREQQQRQPQQQQPRGSSLLNMTRNPIVNKGISGLPAAPIAPKPVAPPQPRGSSLVNMMKKPVASNGIAGLPAAPTGFTPPYSADQYQANLKAVNDRRAILQNQAGQMYKEFVDPTNYYAEVQRLQAADPEYLKLLKPVHDWQGAVYDYYGNTGNWDEMEKLYPFMSRPY